MRHRNQYSGRQALQDGLLDFVDVGSESQADRRAIWKKFIELARAGDVWAIREFLTRRWPPKRIAEPDGLEGKILAARKRVRAHQADMDQRELQRLADHLEAAGWTRVPPRPLLPAHAGGVVIDIDAEAVADPEDGPGETNAEGFERRHTTRGVCHLERVRDTHRLRPHNRPTTALT